MGSRFVEVGVAENEDEDIVSMIKETQALIEDHPLKNDFANKFVELNNEEETFQVFKHLTQHEIGMPELILTNKKHTPEKANRMVEMFFTQLVKMLEEMEVSALLIY